MKQTARLTDFLPYRLSTTSNAVSAEGFSIYLRVMHPFAPHITHVLWQ